MLRDQMKGNKGKRGKRNVKTGLESIISETR
jgi:hypothetical protein